MRKDSFKQYSPRPVHKSSDFLSQENPIDFSAFYSRKSTFLKPKGDPKTAKYIIVSTQPSTQDILNNKMLTGELGMEIENLLRQSNISKADCYFTNVIKDLDRPEGFYFEPKYKNKVIVDYFIHPGGQEYVDLLAKELSECEATTIITLGNLPLFVLSDRISSYKWRSSVIEPTLLGGKNLIPTLDPASILYPQMQYKNKRLIIWDLRRARKVASGNWACSYRNLIIEPSYNQCLNFLSTCEQYGLLNNYIGFDIEMDVFNYEMTCFSLSYDPLVAISIPLIGPRGDYFTLPQEIEILKRLASLLENPDIAIIGQNLSFDVQFMLRKYGISSTNIHDTMVAQKTLLPDYPVGLDFICSTYTDIPYYKDDGKYWLGGGGSFHSGWRYSCLDAIVPLESYPKQLILLKDQRNFFTYERKRNSILPYVYMMEHGIRTNLKTMQKNYDLQNKSAEKVLEELEHVAKQPINPNSPKQVAAYFYDKKNLKVYKSKTGGRSTDEIAMKRIKRKGHKEAGLILKYRSLKKNASTFLHPKKVDPDSRMRTAYKPVGTRFSRAASSENIFGTGNNFQNQPHEVLSHFIADPFYVFYGLDLSQAENRIVAYAGRIRQMIDTFESGQDIHGLTAKIMTLIYYGPERAKNISIHNKAPLGDGTKTWRDWGKKANHGFNYNWTYKAFALKNEIPERDGKTVHGIYHRAYPGLREGFHSYVKRCLNKNRILTNYMGRKTQFCDRLDDKTYRAGYSCIPQGTVGDVIDQRGVNYIYYNPDPLFRFVELLIQIHDQVGFQIPTPYHPEHPVSWDDHTKILGKIKSSLETPLRTHYGVKFIIPVDITIGISLNKDFGRDLKSYDPHTLEAAYLDLKYDHDQRTYHYLEEN